MAEGYSYVDAEKFKCPVCLDLMKNPVTIPCGHSYCMPCISRCWDKGDSIGIHVCPQCRQKFNPRPKLAKNSLLADVVEKLRTEKKCTDSVQRAAGPDDVLCDVCVGSKTKAAKSCLVCLASYCELHLQAHYESPVFKKHSLVKAVGRLQDRICPHHNKLLEFYCQTDKRCICYICMFGDHRAHNVVSAEAERATKKIQKQVAAAEQNSQQRIRTKEKELKELKQAVGNLKHPIKGTLSESCLIRDSLIKAVKQWQADLERLIRDEESRVVNSADAILGQQGEQLAKLQKKHAELLQLSQSDDHIRFLQSFEALCEVGPGTCQENPAQGHDCSRPAVKAIATVRERLEAFCRVELNAFSKRAKEIEGLIFMPKTRADFLRYACPLTLDPNTVNCYLELNKEERSVTCDTSFSPFPDVVRASPTPRPYPVHPERFDHHSQVLCKEPLFGGRFYWEVEGSRFHGSVAVCYGRISRKDNSFLDDLNNSPAAWSVDCAGDIAPYQFRHGPCVFGKFCSASISYGEDRKGTPTKVGVFLDHPAGLLSFYLVRQETMVHMYTFRTTFTEPLHAGLKPAPGCTLKLCDLEPLTPSGSLQ